MVSPGLLLSSAYTIKRVIPVELRYVHNRVSHVHDGLVQREAQQLLRSKDPDP